MTDGVEMCADQLLVSLLITFSYRAHQFFISHGVSELLLRAEFRADQIVPPDGVRVHLCAGLRESRDPVDLAVSFLFR